MTIDIITRADWGARPPRHAYRIDTPTPELWLHHTAGNHRGATGMRAIQNVHMDSRGWSDIAYSFVVDRIDLKVYEGRGAGVAGGHTRGHNRISHAICVMGNFETLIPQPALIDLLAELVAYGHERRWWPAEFTGGHRDASGASTACPGRNLYARIPDINQLATSREPNVPASFVERIRAAAVNAKYTDTGDLDQLADNIQEISVGLMKQLADKELLTQQLARAVGKLDDIAEVLDR